MTQLPLFPLGTVLLPGGSLPMRVFEPRYLELLADMLDRPAGQRCWGVLAIRRGWEVGADAVRNVHSVGCEAAVDTVVEDPSGTAVQVETVGRRRFRLNRVVPSGTPYLMGDVTWLDDEPAPDARTLAAVDEALRGYLRILGLSAVTLDHHDPLLGYRVADAMLLSTADRQAVLAHRSSALQTVFGLLLREIFLIRELRAVPVTGQLSAVRAN